MSYDQNTPRATETPAQSQPLIQGNFLQIATSYNTDHIPLTSGANVGYSNKTTLVSQGSDPAKVAGAGIEYSKTVTYPGAVTHVEEFYEGETSTGKVLQITNQFLTSSAGEGMMPGGVQVRVGSGNFNSGTFSQVTYATQFPTNTLAAVVVANNNGSQWQVDDTSYAATGFKVKSSPNAGGFYTYIAIGY